MSDFDFTILEDGEEIEFGIATSSSSQSQQRVENGVTLQDDSSSLTRRTGVTNRRVVVEIAGAPSSTRTVPNEQVSRIHLRREEFAGQVRLNLQSVETASGELLELGIGLLEAEDEVRMATVFPNAEIVTIGANTDQDTSDKPKKKAIFSFLGFGD